MIKKIRKKIYLIQGKNGGRFPFSDSILVTDRAAGLIDTGCGSEVLERIRKDYAPEMVIYSHGHPDHCSGSSCFAPEQLWGPEEGRDSTGNLLLMARRFIKAELHEDWIS